MKVHTDDPARTRAHTHTHTQTHTHTHTHTHMYACTQSTHTHARAQASLCTFCASILRHHLVDFLNRPSLSLLIFFLSYIVSPPTSTSSSLYQSNIEPSSPPRGTSAYTDCRLCLPPNNVSKCGKYSCHRYVRCLLAMF